jgi:sigma-B regulation protein RsbU (phosphoserine phosphatase)
MQHGDLASEATIGPTRGLHALFNTLDRARPEGQLLDAFVDEAFDALKAELRLLGVLVYAERRDGFALRKVVGVESGECSESLAPSCRPLALVRRHRVYLFADPHEEGSPWLESVLPCLPCAGVAVGRWPHRHVLFFLLDGGWNREHVDFALNVLRVALGLQLLEERVRIDFRQAAEIQESLVREAPPAIPGFEIACRSIPAQEVGGDFFDFVPVGNDLVGFAIGDASGHDLAAALLVRDVVTGLRMGLEKHLRMEYVFAKLNRVIHRSTSASRFVSVFYGELESSGNLSYVNAGHHPPLLFHHERITELWTGGTIIGPLADVTFRRGLARFDPGAVLVLFTDGLVERRATSQEPYGVERLRAVVQANQGVPASELLERAVASAYAFGGGRPWEDDATMMVVRRSEE